VQALARVSSKMRERLSTTPKLLVCVV